MKKVDEILEERDRELDIFYNDPYTEHYGAYECADIVTRPYRRVEAEVERRYWAREREKEMSR